MDSSTKKKLSCLMFIPSMGNGGAERVIATLANVLSEKDYNITIITITSSESFYKLNKSVEIIGMGNFIERKNKLNKYGSLIKSAIQSYLFFNRVIREKKPDIVLSFLTDTNIISLLSKPFHKTTPFIVSERAEPNVRNPFYRFLTKFLYPTADILVCQSNKVAEFFPEYSQKKIKVISNPINEESIPKGLPTERKKVIVGVGRLFPQKNFDLLIDSFYILQNDFPEHKLEIYGEGYLRKQLENKINKMGLNEKVFLKGIKKDVMKHISDAELFVMSSNFEGFPNALVEAMASGLPVISTDFSTGVARDLVKAENGIIVPVEDKKAMYEAMHKILSSFELRNLMSDNNRGIIDVLSTNKIVDKWIEAFNEALTNKPNMERDVNE